MILVKKILLRKIIIKDKYRTYLTFIFDAANDSSLYLVKKKFVTQKISGDYKLF